jgi:hypothetical protein
MIAMTRSSLKTIAGIALLLGLAGGCAGSPWGDSLGQSLEADPQLEESPAFGAEPSTADDVAVVDADATASSTTQNAAPTVLSTAAATKMRVAEAGATNPPDPGDPNFIGPLPPVKQPVADNTPDPALEGVPAELRDYVADLTALAVLPTGTESPETVAFSETISRREYARWLFLANNTFYQDVANQRIRGGTISDQPAFQDIPVADPDFAAIQGLAKAGIIPSVLAGNSTAVNFRPDAPLTREALILWKVPLDIHRALPATTPEAVAERWGFQDVNQVEPLALRAVAADFELGDFSNLRRAFGYTILLQPEQAVTRAEAAAVLWRFGTQTEGRSAADLRGDSQTGDELEASRPSP